MIARNIVLLSKDDTGMDSQGNKILFYEGMPVSIYQDDIDENGKPDNLIGEGIAVKTDIGKYPHYEHVKWIPQLYQKAI